MGVNRRDNVSVTRDAFARALAGEDELRLVADPDGHLGLAGEELGESEEPPPADVSRELDGPSLVEPDGGESEVGANRERIEELRRVRYGVSDLGDLVMTWKGALVVALICVGLVLVVVVQVFPAVEAWALGIVLGILLMLGTLCLLAAILDVWGRLRLSPVRDR
jgi:hypothetical protein